MNAERGGDDNGNNDDHSVAAAALEEYPEPWRANPHGGGGGRIGAITGIGESGTVRLSFSNLPAARCKDCHATQQSA
jgi:hypothetical protein